MTPTPLGQDAPTCESRIFSPLGGKHDRKTPRLEFDHEDDFDGTGDDHHRRYLRIARSWPLAIFIGVLAWSSVGAQECWFFTAERWCANWEPKHLKWSQEQDSQAKCAEKSAEEHRSNSDFNRANPEVRCSLTITTCAPCSSPPAQQGYQPERGRQTHVATPVPRLSPREAGIAAGVGILGNLIRGRIARRQAEAEAARAAAEAEILYQNPVPYDPPAPLLPPEPGPFDELQVPGSAQQGSTLDELKIEQKANRPPPGLDELTVGDMDPDSPQSTTRHDDLPPLYQDGSHPNYRFDSKNMEVEVLDGTGRTFSVRDQIDDADFEKIKEENGLVVKVGPEGNTIDYDLTLGQIEESLRSSGGVTIVKEEKGKPSLLAEIVQSDSAGGNLSVKGAEVYETTTLSSKSPYSNLKNINELALSKEYEGVSSASIRVYVIDDMTFSQKLMGSVGYSILKGENEVGPPGEHPLESGAPDFVIENREARARLESSLQQQGWRGSRVEIAAGALGFMIDASAYMNDSARIAVVRRVTDQGPSYQVFARSRDLFSPQMLWLPWNYLDPQSARRVLNGLVGK